MEKNVRLRVLLVMEVLFERTDEEHGISMGEIIEWLAEHGVRGNRKSVYEDIHALQEYGLCVEYSPEDKTYHLMERAMELPELKLLVDAIHASKFITRKRTDQMISHVMDMASAFQRGALKREIYSEKPKSPSATGFYSMDTLHQAMASNCQVAFHYGAWNLNKELEYKHDGALYQVSPWLMVWAEENYYLVAYDSQAAQIKHFRVDKISDVELLEEKRTGKQEFEKLDTTNYSTNHFGMYGGELKRVTVQFENRFIGVVLDRFGTDIQIVRVDENYFKAALPVVVSGQFFGWLFALGSQVKILSEEVAKEYQEYLQKVLAIYEISI